MHINIPDQYVINVVKQPLKELGLKNKLNAIWIETSGCFGEIISLLDGVTPDILYLLNDLVNITYFESIMADQGENAYKRLLEIINTEYILIISGAISLKDNGLFTILATYNNEKITVIKALDLFSKKAKHIIAVGTCASFGGPTAASPNVSQSISVQKFLNRNDVINIPGCPANPIWTYGILDYLVNKGVPELDSYGRPKAYYGERIHENCERRHYFDKGIFATKLGDKECMFNLGCKGPITNTNCPIDKWNNSSNWPIGTNSLCIGCSSPNFPDNNEPFINYGGE